MIRLMKRILAVAGVYRGRIKLAFVFSFLKALLSKMPIGLAFIAFIEFYRGEMTSGICLGLGAAMLLSVVLQCIFQNISDRLQAAAGYMVFADMRMDMGAHLRKMPMGYFTEGNIGKISSVLSTDMVFIEENCMHDIADMMSYIFAQAIMVVFLFTVNPWLGLVSAVIVLAIFLLGTASIKSTMKHSDILQAQSEKLTNAVLDYTEGIGIIKTYNLLGKKSKELSDNFQKSCRVNLDFEEAMTPWQLWLNILCGLGAAAMVAAALILNAGGSLEVTLLVGVLLFVFDLFGPVKALYSQTTRLTVMNSCMDRIEEVSGKKELPDEGTETIPAAGNGAEVEFKDVHFTYQAEKEKESREILHGVTFTLTKNSMLALVGPSGGGKSTVANLLARFWDVNSGQVLIRGKDVRKVRLSDLMNHISMVFQRVYLFQDTVYNNISMGRPDASREEIMEAAKKARCYDFVMELPDGFDTVIGEGGASLSGGEQQRISIARCILKDAPVVILDEATASVDADNERYIQEAISELCRGKTLLVIAHRLNTIRNADKSLVIADGEIVQSGSHDELMEQNGTYRNFVTLRQNSQGWNQRAEV